jgi:hypothetical protein
MMKIKYTYERGALATAFQAKYKPIARAATGAMKEVATAAKEGSRASIRASGGDLGRKWPNAVRSRVYPDKGKPSASPAGLIWVRSDYAGLFEDGGTITGKPLLWVPILAVWRKIGIKPIRPPKMTGVVSIPRPGKAPLLGIRVKGTASRFAKGITATQLRKGTSAKRGIIKTIPLWIGLPAVTIGKKWHIREACERAAARLPGLYYKNLRDE